MPASRETFDHWYERARAWWRAYLANPANGGVMLQADVSLGLQVKPTLTRRLLERAVQDGELLRRGGRLGYMLPNALGSVVHLGVVLQAARDVVDPTYAPKRGRQATDRLARVERLSESQYDKAAAAAGVIAWGLGYKKDELHRVGPEHLVWEPVPETYEGDRRGRFPLVERVAEWSDAKARAEYRGEGWHRDMNADARAAHVAGARVLLNFATTRGWVRLSDTPAAELRTYAAPWQPWIEVNATALAARARSDTQRFNMLDGCRVLAQFATACGAPKPVKVDWQAVIDAIETAALGAERSLAHTRYLNAKGAYRRLRELNVVHGPMWGAAARSAHGIVTGEAFDAGASNGDFSAWPQWLTQGHYGIADWHCWANEASTPDERRRRGLPPREYVQPTKEQVARMEAALRERRNLFSCRASTLVRYTRYLSALGGFATSDDARAEGVQLSGEGLVRLCDTALLDAYASWWCRGKARPAHEQERAPWLHGMAKTMSVIASPYLEARARQLGDTVLADRLRAASQELFAWAKRHQPPRRSVSSADKKVHPWQADGGSAWDKLRAIRDCIAADVERLGRVSNLERLGRVPVAEQIAAIRQGTFRCTRPRDWSLAVRDAVIFTLQLRLPLRPENVCELGLPSRRGARDGSFHFTGDEPWLGALSAHYRDDEMKASQPFEGPIIVAGEVGVPDAEADLRRDLWELWLMPGGARDHVRTLEPAREGRPARLVPTRAVFPAYARHGKPNEREARARAGLHLTGQSVLAMFKARIIQHGPAVGLDVRAALSTYGAAGDHVFRHALATWADERGEGENASRLLAHRRRGNTTQAHYTGQDAMRVSIDAMRRRVAGRMSTGTVQASVGVVEPTGVAQQSDTLAGLAKAFAMGALTAEEFRAAIGALQA